MYVWFEAVMGYFTASIEWAHNIGQPDAWKKWWYNPDAKIYNFIGKDNIEFHTIIWPAELMGDRWPVRRRERRADLTCPTTCPPTSS